MEDSNPNSLMFESVKVEVRFDYPESNSTMDTNTELKPDIDVQHSIFSSDFSFLAGTDKMEDQQGDTEDDDAETKNSGKRMAGSKQGIYKCDQCSYQTNYSGFLTRHIKGHNAIYECETCQYKTRRRYDLKRHILQHKDPQEVFIFNCTECEYQTDQRFKLKRHSIIHMKDNVEKHMCAECNFESIHKKVLQKHILIHKDRNEFFRFKCTDCSYETSRADDLRKHRLQHQETKIFLCSICDFQTHVENKLIRHSVNHQNTGKIKNHVCKECGYKAWNKGALYWHRFTTHKATEVYKCDVCNFQTIHKRSFRDHSFIHKDPDDADMHKCELCPYKTFRKRDLKKHLVIHQTPDGTNIFKCDICQYQTVNKAYFRRHFQRHESAQLCSLLEEKT